VVILSSAAHLYWATLNAVSARNSGWERAVRLYYRNLNRARKYIWSPPRWKRVGSGYAKCNEQTFF